jgi:N-acetylgalactosamine-N,N'-diacetylbacillosaminyl-diphospho-undecaprenol 4-alpha-N-acetylgalactosaminyltransferase
MIIIKKLRVNVLKNAILINDLRNGGAEKVVSKIVNNNPNILLLIQIWPEQFHEVSSEKTFFLLKRKGFIFFDLLKACFALNKLLYTFR